MSRYRYLLLLVLFLASCAAPARKPAIEFIGMSSGTLTSDLNKVEFRSRFDITETKLVGVVSFADVQNKTVVQATWHSPDDRTMPLGRTQIVTQSGARIARFGFARGIPWDSAPYFLDIRAWPEEDPLLTASGSAQFFIGMKDEEIETYWTEKAAWEAEREKQRREAEEAAAEAEATSGSLLGSGMQLET